MRQTHGAQCARLLPPPSACQVLSKILTSKPASHAVSVARGPRVFASMILCAAHRWHDIRRRRPDIAQDSFHVTKECASSVSILHNPKVRHPRDNCPGRALMPLSDCCKCFPLSDSKAKFIVFVLGPRFPHPRSLRALCIGIASFEDLRSQKESANDMRTMQYIGTDFTLWMVRVISLREAINNPQCLPTIHCSSGTRHELPSIEKFSGRLANLPQFSQSFILPATSPGSSPP